MPHLLSYFYLAQRQHQLTALSLKNRYLGDQLMGQLLAWNDCSAIRSVDLEGNRLSDSSIRELFRQDLPLLNHLNLRNNLLTGKVFQSTQPES